MKVGATTGYDTSRSTRRSPNSSPTKGSEAAAKPRSGRDAGKRRLVTPPATRTPLDSTATAKRQVLSPLWHSEKSKDERSADDRGAAGTPRTPTAARPSGEVHHTSRRPQTRGATEGAARGTRRPLHRCVADSSTRALRVPAELPASATSSTKHAAPTDGLNERRDGRSGDGDATAAPPLRRRREHTRAARAR